MNPELRKKLILKNDELLKSDYWRPDPITTALAHGLTAGHGPEQGREPVTATEKTLSTIAEFAGMTLPFAGAMKVGGTAMKLAGLKGGIGRIAGEAAGGAVYGMMEPAEDEREKVAHVLENALIFGAFGVAGEGLRAVIKKIRGAKGILRKDEVETVGETIKQLPPASREKVIKLLPPATRDRVRAEYINPRVIVPEPAPGTSPPGAGPSYGQMIRAMRRERRVPVIETGERKLLPAEGMTLKRIKPGEAWVKKSETSNRLLVTQVRPGEVVLKEGFRPITVPMEEFRRNYMPAPRLDIRSELESMPKVSRKIHERIPARQDIEGKDIIQQAKEVRSRIAGKSVKTTEVTKGTEKAKIEGKAKLEPRVVALQSDWDNVLEAEIEGLRLGGVTQGGVKKVGGVVVGRYGSTSTNPDWFQRRISGTYSKRDVINTMQKVIDKKPLTPRQQSMFEDIAGAINEDLYSKVGKGMSDPVFTKAKAEGKAKDKPRIARIDTKEKVKAEAEAKGKADTGRKVKPGEQVSFKPQAELPRGPIKTVGKTTKPVEEIEGGLFEKPKPKGKQLEIEGSRKARKVHKETTKGTEGTKKARAEQLYELDVLKRKIQKDGGRVLKVYRNEDNAIIVEYKFIEDIKRKHDSRFATIFSDGSRSTGKFGKKLVPINDKLRSVSPVGMAAGFEQDENGNWSYDPSKGIVGMLGAMAVGPLIGAKQLRRIRDLGKKIGGNSLKTVMSIPNFAGKKLEQLREKEANIVEDILKGIFERKTGKKYAEPAAKAAERFVNPKVSKGAEKVVEKATKPGSAMNKGRLPGEEKGFTGFIKEQNRKFKKFMDGIADTDFDKANMERYGESAWKKGQVGNEARRIDEAIKKELIGDKKILSRTEKEALRDFKAAVTINLERPKFKSDKEFQQAMYEAIGRLQDPVSKQHLQNVSKIIQRNDALLQKYTKDFRGKFEEWKKVLSDEDMANDFVEYYVTHVWKIEKGANQFTDPAIKTQFQYIKERMVPDYLTGIKYGLKPRSLDVVAIAEHYEKTMAEVLANRKFIQELKGLSVELPNMEAVRAALPRKKIDELDTWLARQYRSIKHPAFGRGNNQIWVHNTIYKDINAIFGPSLWKQYGPGKKYIKWNQFMKRAKLAASGFHHVALGFNNVFFHGDKWYKVGNPLPFDIFNWKSGYKKGLEAYYKKNPLLEHGVRHGLTLDEAGAMADYYMPFKRNMSKWPEKETGKAMKNLATDFVHMWDDALWGKYYTGSKAMAYMCEYGKNLKYLEKKYPKLYEQWKATGFAKTGKTEYEKLAAQIAARDVNTLYGGLNYELLKMSATTRDTLRAFVLAPDWQMSNWMYTINALRGARGKPATVAAARQMLKVMTMVTGLGNMLNYVTTGRMIWDNPEGYKGMVAIGNNDGKPYYIDFFRHFGEFMKVVKYGNPDRPTTYVYDSPIRYLVNKSSQLIRVIDAIRTGEDWRGRPLADWQAISKGKTYQSKYTPWWERGSVLPGIGYVIGESFVPIPVQTMARSVMGDESKVVGGASVFGIHVKEYRGNRATWKLKKGKTLKGYKGFEKF